MSCNNSMAFFPANFMFQNPNDNDHHHHHHHHQSHPPPPSSCSLPQDFHGMTSFLGKRTQMTSYSGNRSNFEGCCEVETGNMNGEEELSDDGSQMGEKKRRLSLEQVKALEKSFEIGNKLEPERKMQLAKTLNLQPRQVAIWFQNRRARWKTKQLEKDFDILKRQFENLKAENEILRAQNQDMLAQIAALKSREPTESINLNKETEGSCSNRSDNSPPEIDSSLAVQPPPTTGRHFFPTSPATASAVTTTTMQFFQGSSSGQSIVKDENSISNMFCNIDDQSGFWPWLDQSQFS